MKNIVNFRVPIMGIFQCGSEVRGKEVCGSGNQWPALETILKKEG
jgi:hypothetical protein